MISDYSELIAEATHRTGILDVATRAKMYVGMAEQALSRSLRVADMEQETTLTTNASGTVDLPTDYVSMREVLVAGKTLRCEALSPIRREARSGYAIQGNVLHSSEKETEHDLIYYAAIPSLEEANTNWLLTANPELYLQAVMFQIYTAAGEADRARATGDYVLFLVNQMIGDDHLSRFGNMRIAVGRAPQ